MSRYTATIIHHSISQSAEIDVGDNLSAAKRRATKELGDGFIDHTIVIMDRQLPEWDNVVASRRIGDRRWDSNPF